MQYNTIQCFAQYNKALGLSTPISEYAKIRQNVGDAWEYAALNRNQNNTHEPGEGKTGLTIVTADCPEQAGDFKMTEQKNCY